MVLPITWNIPILPKLCKNYIKIRTEITDQKDVSNELFDFYNNLYKSNKRRPNHDLA